ncbi:MAG: type II secretion system F family protein, partial [archaeon]
YQTTEKVLKEISKGHGELSKEFKKTYKEIETGETVKKALKNMGERTDSKLVKRATQVLINGHESGSNLSKALEETAEEAKKLHEIKRKRKLSTTIEKYTLLLAGGLVVPFILGTLTSVIGSLELGTITHLSIGVSEEIREQIKNNAVKGNQIYIAIYSVIASLFVSYQEKEMEKALIYIVILLPTALAIFNISKTVNILEIL